jgi:multiple sugar transport system substrate-binding protein
MKTVDFSIFDHGTNAVEIMRSVLARFEREHRIHVNLEVIPWPGAWARIIQFAIYNDGPTVSEIGSTWVNDMVMMKALRPFTLREVRNLGGEESYLPASWQSVRAIHDPSISEAVSWAIPWVADTRLIYYRKDLFAQVDQAAREAFSSHAELESCLQALQDHGVEYPLSLPTSRSRINLHILAGWIWAAGADFLTEDGKKAIFDSPQALDGMEKFFRLGRFLHSAARRLNDEQSDALFWQGRAALAISGPWLFDYPLVDPKLKEQFAVAVPPGVPFVGGFHLVIWKHARQESAALELIEYLAGSRLPEELFPAFSLPARVDVLDRSQFATHPVYRVMGAAMRAGRSFPVTWMWGMLENRLFESLQVLWDRVLSDPESEFRTTLESHIHGLVQRVDLTLNS